MSESPANSSALAGPNWSPEPGSDHAPPQPARTESSDQEHTLGNLLWAIFDPHLQGLKTPLPWPMRFMIAFSGSLSLFSVFLVSGSLSSDSIENDLTEFVFLSTGLDVPIIWFVVGILSAFFAGLISALPTQSGPVRLFLAGLLLPALAVNVVQWTWGFEVLP